MKNKASFNHLLRQTSLFWEVDPKELMNVLVQSDDWVVGRVFEHGSLDDIAAVIALYGKDKVSAILNEANLKPVAAVMAYLFLGVDRYRRYNFVN